MASNTDTVLSQTHEYAVRYAEQMIAQRYEALQDLRVAYGLMDRLMAWDNNVLDDPSACKEYKQDIQNCLEWLGRNRDLADDA